MPGPELYLLLEILSGKAESKVPEMRLDTEYLISLAQRHRITYLLLQFARKNPQMFTGWQLEVLNSRAKHNAVRSLLQLRELTKIGRRFNLANIAYACIKGPQLSRMLYGKEALKESVDLDLMLIDLNDLMAVHHLLSEMGYSQSNLNDFKSRFARKIFLLAKREVHYYNPENGCHIDLHVRAAANAYLTAGRYRNLFTGLVSFDLEGISVPILAAEKYLTYLCHHGAIHQFGSLGWLLDIRYYITRMGKEMDPKETENVAKVMKAERSLCLSLILMNDVFGDDLSGPLADQCRSDSFIRYLISSCWRAWGKESDYAMSVRGRIGRFLYLMALSRGLSAKADLILGIFIRSTLPLIRWLKL